MLNNKIIQIMQNYIGKNIFIYFHAVEPDPYFGLQDVSPPRLVQETIDNFCVLKNTIIIKTKNNKEYDLKEVKIFLQIDDLINT